MTSKYTALPSNDYQYYSRRSTSPSSPHPPISNSLYLPPYQSHNNTDPTRLSFTTDIEQDAHPNSNANTNIHRRRATPDSPLPAYDSDPRFKMETPSPITRAALIAFLCFLFWLAFNLRKGVWMATGMGMEKQDMEPVDLSY